MLYMNWGIDGRSNGYYTWSIFDVSEEFDRESVLNKHNKLLTNDDF